MLMILATDKSTSKNVIITHEISNRGKSLVEEHTIRVYREDPAHEGVLLRDHLLGTYVISAAHAKELKAHL